MNLLLDTHSLLWWMSDDSKLPGRSRDLIANPANTVFLSSVIIWEIRIKQALGKLSVPAAFRDAVDAEDFAPLPISQAHAHAVYRLPAIHRDPFDRMLVAQAGVEGMVIVTQDAVIREYGVEVA